MNAEERCMNAEKRFLNAEKRFLNNNIVLVNFYNEKAVGVRHIETALIQAGYNVTVIFFKNLNFSSPQFATTIELRLLVNLIKEKNPLAVGFSVMASLYIETVIAANNAIKEEFDAPIIWGGMYPTMFAESCLDHADFIIRGEGEETFIELADALNNESDFHEISNLAYRREVGGVVEVVQNDIRNLLIDLDKFGWPKLDLGNKYKIDNDTVKKIDPVVGSMSYEISCSRGCPYACSYCCSATWKKIHIGKGRSVRFRDIDKVIEELIHAKSMMKNLKFVRFYDEIFPDDEDWIDIFIEKYTKHINMPFEIWGHPLRTDAKIFAKLSNAGLYKAVVGIQSGSPYIRRKIFNRVETQEDIINASQAMTDAKVPEIVYDLMVRHHFETHDTLRETLTLCLDLKGSFELQIHGLNFLPGTSIVQKALDMDLVTPSEMERFMYAPIKEQYEMYWRNENCDDTMNYIYKLIYMSQLSFYKKKVRRLSDPNIPEDHVKVNRMYNRAQKFVYIRHIYKKLIMLGKGFLRT